MTVTRYSAYIGMRACIFRVHQRCKTGELATGYYRMRSARVITRTELADGKRNCIAQDRVNQMARRTLC